MSGSAVAGKGAGATMVAGVAGPVGAGAAAFWGGAIGAFVVAARDAERECFFVTVMVSGLDDVGSSDRLATSRRGGGRGRKWNDG